MSTSPLERYTQEIEQRVSSYEDNAELGGAARAFFDQIGVGKADYVYNFFWLGVPVIQLPQDLIAFQELIWRVRPDLIIETGVAWGGSLLYSASILAVLEACDLIEQGIVLGIDIEVRPHNKQALAEHPLGRKLRILEGSSTDPQIIDEVRTAARGATRVMVFLDSNHTHDHVLAELEAYAPLVSDGSYCVVGDTVIEDAPPGMVAHRPWGAGNSPKSAVWEYLRRLARQDRMAADGTPLRFEIDRLAERKLLVTGSPDGFLRRI